MSAISATQNKNFNTTACGNALGVNTTVLSITCLATRIFYGFFIPRNLPMTLIPVSLLLAIQVVSLNVRIEIKNTRNEILTEQEKEFLKVSPNITIGLIAMAVGSVVSSLLGSRSLPALISTITFSAITTGFAAPHLEEQYGQLINGLVKRQITSQALV